MVFHLGADLQEEDPGEPSGEGNAAEDGGCGREMHQPEGQCAHPEPEKGKEAHLSALPVEVGDQEGADRFAGFVLGHSGLSSVCLLYICRIAALSTAYCCCIEIFMGKNLKKAKSVRFSDEELDLIEQLMETRGRNFTETLVDAVYALRDQSANEPSDTELVQMMAARLGVKLKGK